MLSQHDDAQTGSTSLHGSGRMMVPRRRAPYVPADGPLDVTQISRAEYDDPACHNHDPHAAQYHHGPEEEDWLEESYPPKRVYQQQQEPVSRVSHRVSHRVSFATAHAPSPGTAEMVSRSQKQRFVYHATEEEEVTAGKAHALLQQRRPQQKHQHQHYHSEEEEEEEEDDDDDDDDDDDSDSEDGGRGRAEDLEQHERRSNDSASPPDVRHRLRRGSVGGSGSRSARRRKSELERLREVYASGIDPSELHNRGDLSSRRRMNDMREEAALRHVYGSGNGSLSSRRREAVKKDEAIRLAYGSGGGSASARKAPRGLTRSNSFNGRWG